MNTDRFRYETAPVYRNPALEGRPGWYGEGPVPDQGPYETEMVPTGLPEQDPRYAGIYAARIDGGYQIPAVPYRQIDARYWRARSPIPSASGRVRSSSIRRTATST